MKRHTLRGFAAILCGLFLLGLGGCVSLPLQEQGPVDDPTHDYIGSGD